MNVTLAMPVDLVADSRRYAAEHGTTLNALIRDLLEGLRTKRKEKKEREALVEEMLDFMRNHAGRSPKGWKFDREECHVRNPERGW
jgi:hypothetical protein